MQEFWWGFTERKSNIYLENLKRKEKKRKEGRKKCTCGTRG